MTELQALRMAVLAAPDDDLPRLVMADWLDENGQPERAEFIRVQCELAKLPDDLPHCVLYADRETCVCGECGRWRRQRDLRQRERELWDGGVYYAFKHSLPDGVHPLLPRWMAMSSLTAEVRRGFVASARVTIPAWFGVPCPNCRLPPRPASDRWCPLCHNSRSLPAVGPALLRGHPVGRLEVWEVTPREWPSGCWQWDGGGTEASDLPECLFPEFDGETYATEAEARAALSAGMIDWALAEIGESGRIRPMTMDTAAAGGVVSAAGIPPHGDDR